MEISNEEYKQLIERALRSEQRADQLSAELTSIRESLNRLDVKLDQILMSLNNPNGEPVEKGIRIPSVPHIEEPDYTKTNPYQQYPWTTPLTPGIGDWRGPTCTANPDWTYRPELDPVYSDIVSSSGYKEDAASDTSLYGKTFINRCISNILSNGTRTSVKCDPCT